MKAATFLLSLLTTHIHTSSYIPTEMWAKYVERPPQHLQQKITAAIDKNALNQFRIGATDADRARLISSMTLEGDVADPNVAAQKDSGSLAGQWLVTLPVRPEYQLSSTEFNLAIRHRLGMKPADCMPLPICMCNRVSFADDAQHFMSCSSLKRLPVLTRHNGVANVIADIARRASCYVEHEFMIRDASRDHDHSMRAGPHAYGNHHDQSSSNHDRGSIPDLLVAGAEMSAFVDIAISNPAAPSYAAQAAARRFGGVAAMRAAQKHAKYDDICRTKNLEMIPFAVESFGAMDGEALKFVTGLCQRLPIHARAAALQHALISLSFALQRGNATISTAGLAYLRMYLARLPNRRVAL